MVVDVVTGALETPVLAAAVVDGCPNTTSGPVLEVIVVDEMTECPKNVAGVLGLATG